MSLPDASQVLAAPAHSTSTLPLVFCIVLGVSMVATGAWLWGRPQNEALFHLVNDLGPAAPTLWSLLSVAGLGGAVWIYVGATHARQPQRVAALLWVIVVGGTAVHWIKHGLATPRPLGLLSPDLVHVTGEVLRTQSMPSGHSAMAFALLTLMARGRGFGNARAAGASSAWIALGLGIALSRLAVGAHWPSDLLFGGGMGVLAALLAPRAWGVAWLADRMARPLGCRVMAAVFAVSGAAMAVTHTGYPFARPLQWALTLLAVWGAWDWWRSASRSVASAPVAAPLGNVAGDVTDHVPGH